MKTIKMKKADWEKWDAALRSGEYTQGAEALFLDGAYCCLGVLQHCLTGAIEPRDLRGSDELPSEEWLRHHGIEFRGRGNDPDRQPWLPLIGDSAAVANDEFNEDEEHEYDFVRLADAIKDTVEFTDA